MQKESRGIVIIGWLLVLTHPISVYGLRNVDAFVFNEYVILAFSIAITIAAMLSAFLKEIGRVGLIVTNLILASYLLMVTYIFDRPDILSYVLLSVIIILFYNQTKIKSLFCHKSKDEWKSILVVDDDDTLINTVRPILISNGYSVLTANTGETGLHIIRTQKPDMVILDVILPGVKGRDVCKQIKENRETKHIPVIFLTAKDSPDDIEAEMAAGAETHLTKPVNARTLLNTVKEVLGQN